MYKSASSALNIGYEYVKHWMMYGYSMLWSYSKVTFPLCNKLLQTMQHNFPCWIWFPLTYWSKSQSSPVLLKLIECLMYLRRTKKSDLAYKTSYPVQFLQPLLKNHRIFEKHAHQYLQTAHNFGTGSRQSQLDCFVTYTGFTRAQENFDRKSLAGMFLYLWNENAKKQIILAEIISEAEYITTLFAVKGPL